MISIKFSSLHNGANWLLTNTYARSTSLGKRDFLAWFKNIQMADDVHWLVLEDFNLCRSLDDSNKPGGNHHEIMYLFSDAISALGLVNLPLKGRRFTWSNRHLSPLLEHLE